MILKLLDRHLISNVLSSIGMVALMLMGIEILVVFIGELGNIGTGNYGVLQALRYVLLDMPYQLNDLFPMAGLVGSLLGLGVLAQQSELIVMQTSGFSSWQIAQSVLKAGFLMVALTFILGEIIAPKAEKMANQGRAFAKSGNQILPTSEGLWLRQANQFIHIDKVENSKYLSGIKTFVVSPNQNLAYIDNALHAEKIAGKWYLEQGSRSIFLSEKMSIQNYHQELWEVKFDPKLLAIAQSEPRNMSLVYLWRYISYLHSNHLNAKSYELSFWKRLVEPFSNLVMIFIAVPFIFGPLRSSTMGLRIVAGIAMGFSYYLLNQFFAPLGTLYQWPAFLTASFPTFIFIAIGSFLFQRIKA